MNISVIIPSYNEEGNLQILLPELNKILSSLHIGFELLVIDALMSEDNSKQVCDINNAKYIKQKEFGYADAFRTGIELSQFNCILVVDADNSQDISKIPEMYDKMLNGADVVIGSRYADGGTTDDPPTSVFMSKLLNYTYRILLGFNEKDVSTDFRMYRKELLDGIVTECSNFDVIEETLFYLKNQYKSLKIVEVPINYRQRSEGVSKRKLFVFICDYIRLLFRLFHLRITKKG
ncbi:MAG: glycosyltransferase [Clostridia bacterium]|nr:glycosyltransferase [Clostridia bacterium]